MSKQEKYRESVLELSDSWGPRAERYILLAIAFLLSWPLFIPALIFHAKVAGLKNEDKDLMCFYFPLMLIEAVLTILPLGFFGFEFIYYTAYIGFVLSVGIRIFILLDVYYLEFDDKKITFNIFSSSKSLFPRKSVKGFTLNGEIG